MRDVVWDMETGDPDDFLTLLLLLLGHPGVNLVAVTVTPGGADQVAMVRWGLAQFGVDIPVGAFHDPATLERTDQQQFDRIKDRVSGWHYKVFARPDRCYEALPAWEVLRDHLGPETTLITGAPLKNLGQLLDELSAAGETPDLGRWFCQGGFAGDNVVPPERRLPKFEGKLTCPTYNLNGAPKAALKAMETPLFSERRLVSKNVCHGVYYDRAMQDRLGALLDEPDGYPLERTRLAHRLIHKGMSAYLRKRADGKKFHDPLAACCALNPDIGVWAEVEMYREKGQWGANPAPGSSTRIITGYDHEAFVQTLLAR